MPYRPSLSFGLCALLLVAVSGCSTFQPQNINQLGQFSSYPLNTQTFRVSAKTTPNISYGMTQEMTLVKAAQITIQNGFSDFKILNDPSSINQPPKQTVIYTPPLLGFRPHRFYSPWDDASPIISQEPNEVAYSITCYKKTQTIPTDAFNATLILKSLGAKYGVAENGDILSPQTKKTS